MMMKILDGKLVSERILDKISKRVRKEGIHPHVAVILVGTDAASHLYVSLKEKAAQSVGIDVSLYRFLAQESQNSVLECLKLLNNDEEIDGILVQLPLPEGFDTDTVIKAIMPQKDVDGFSSESGLPPVFPKAIMSLIESSGEQISGKSGVVLANSEEFGEAMVTELVKNGVDSKYILIDELDKRREEIEKADVVITALGRPGAVVGNMLSKNAIVIDGGIHKENDKVRGDVDPDTLSDFEGYLSPVPGGVGPVTIACLLENVLEAALRRRG